MAPTDTIAQGTQLPQFIFVIESEEPSKCLQPVRFMAELLSGVLKRLRAQLCPFAEAVHCRLADCIACTQLLGVGSVGIDDVKLFFDFIPELIL